MNAYIQIRSVWVFALVCALSLLGCVLCVLSVLYCRMTSRLRRELSSQATDMEFKVEKAQAVAKAKSDFLSRMSHEIRTPLNAIIGMAQIAKNTSDPNKIKDCMTKMEDSSKHLLGVVNDILDFSKIESGHLVLEEKMFSLTRNIDFVVSMFRMKIAEKNLTLRLAITNIEHDQVVTDMLRLNQVLINLLSNAVKFTDPGGIIELSVEELLHLNGESVFEFTVRDNGIGIAPDQVQKLFTPFTQANAGVSRVYGGTGLGLAISQNIVRMMGGDIELETAPGKGSTFQFTIRVSAKDAPEQQEENEQLCAPPEKLRGKRIMIVDDVAINREIVEALLDGSGALIETVMNGKEALDAFCNAEPYRYDLILMDMLMPVMDGCAATMEIRDSGKQDSQDVKIIAMTANVLPEDIERAHKAGMNAYLTKPIDIATLYASLEEWL